jgi:hypothetical protein
MLVCYCFRLLTIAQMWSRVRGAKEREVQSLQGIKSIELSALLPQARRHFASDLKLERPTVHLGRVGRVRLGHGAQ